MLKCNSIMHNMSIRTRCVCTIIVCKIVYPVCILLVAIAL